MSASIPEIIERAVNGQATLRDGYVLLDIMQRECDRLQEMIDGIDNAPTPHDPRVLIRVDHSEKRFRFESVDWLAEWLAKGWITE